MFRGFFNKPKKEDVSFNEEEFWSALSKYVLDTLHGIHSGFVKVYLGMVPCIPPMKEVISNSKIGDFTFYSILTKSLEGYVNKTAESFVARDDPYVNEVFDNFKKLLGGKLPCCFYHHVCDLIQEVVNELARDQEFNIPPSFTPEQALEAYLYNLDLFIVKFLEERKSKFLEITKQDMNNCTKGMDHALYKRGSFFQSTSNDDE